MLKRLLALLGLEDPADDPTSNAALKAWLLANPHLDISQYPHLYETHSHPSTEAADYAA